ncbi:hypothetical protein [Lysinibacillus fusiformis]|uniref:hypothetical protein n=1 Tax=Lysinibacillus fusiformis TaxID=28031 RepID=UPI00148D1243|nr:hypothetical protein [Lysinibacillus fusiformis]NOG29062.1 hypothetical protein [Lysinibacillus fusiformis]
MQVEDLEKVSLALQENAKDFIEKGLSYIIEDEIKDYKYSLLHIFSGTLLFLKDVLYKEHWSFLFQDIDKAKKSDLLENKIISVNFTTLLFRLENLSDVKLEKELKDDLQWMQKERNKIEHFYNPINHHEVRSRIASLLGNLISFINDLHKSDPDFDFDNDYDYRHKYQSLFEVLQKYSLMFETYIEKRSLRIKKDLEACDLVIHCPLCKQKTLEIKIDDGLTICHFCLSEHTADMFYDKYNHISLDPEFYMDDSNKCPKCWSNKLYENTYEVICFYCFERYEHSELSNCYRCDTLIHESLSGYCESCWEDLMSY